MLATAVENGDWILLGVFFAESERGLYPPFWIMLFSSQRLIYGDFL